MTKTRKLQFYKMSIEELDNYILHKATLYEAYWIWNNLASPDDCWIHHMIGTSCYKRIGDLKNTFHKNYESHFCRRALNMQNWSIRQIKKKKKMVGLNLNLVNIIMTSSLQTPNYAELE